MKNLLIWILFVLVGCTAQKEDIPKHIKGTENLVVYSGDMPPTASVDLVREATFEAPDKYSLKWHDDTVSFYSWLESIEVDTSGRVFIADNDATKIHVFDPAGNYLKSLGRKGSGPGEFQSITNTQIGSSSLYVFDFRGFRTTVYSLDSLKVIESNSVKSSVNQDEFDEINGWLRWRLLIRNNGTYLAGFRKQRMDARAGSPNSNLDKDRPKKYYFMDKESNITSDEVFEVKKSREILTTRVEDRHLSNFRPLPFLGRTVIRISDDNHIYTTWTDDFLIKVYGPDGNYQRAIYYPFQKRPIKREELLGTVDKDDWNRGLVEHAELPKTWPAIHSIVVDDRNRLWVSTIIPEDGMREWRVMENTGELIAKFRWPKSRSIKTVKNGYAYVCVTDEEMGQQRIVKYRIQMN
ncbi:6-bladed beta-propeller [Fodinibius halophilus]|uniref:6-bladed beta-propeller n=1 Tax=Fodinibius halophilus TaxID=1736908 RepID=A0A6M1T188_9BACT|nr:6-bladed beta-propeller [Fodinibius halophilus]NGP87729.1 6-bladed beta-propeller [Fodinibius halophilus]